MIAQGTLLDCAVDSASPSSWRTRPRLGRPDSTSMLARLVSRSWVLRTSVTSEPTPRKPWNWPAMSMIGSPARLIQRVPRRVFSSISRLAKGSRASRVRPSALLPPRVAGSEWPISWLAERPSRDVIRDEI